MTPNAARKNRSPSSTSRLSREVRFLRVLCTTTLVVLTGLLLVEETIRLRHGRNMSTDASYVNLAGRQRTLSLQIVGRGLDLLAKDKELFQAESATLLEELQRFTEEFQESHQALTQTRPFGLQSRNSETVRELFQSLQPHYQRLVDAAQTILQRQADPAWDDSDRQVVLGELRESADQFLPIMDRLASAYESDLQAGLSWNERVSGILTTTTITLVVLAFFVLVRPMLRRSMEAAAMTELALAESERATREASQLAAFARHSTNAMIRTDKNRHITWINEGFSRITGYPTQEAVGKSPGELLQCEQTDPKVVQAMRRALNAGHSFRGRILNRSKSGQDYWLDLEIIPEFDQDANVTGFIAIESDVTELVKAKEEAESARRLADKANRAKSEFVANMSHEIRTPMTAILGFTDLMTGEIADDPEQSADAVRTIQTNARHLLTIINDILDVSKLDAGQLKIESVETNPIQIVEEAARLSRPNADQKNIDFHVRYETPVPERIESDPTRLRQILLNLISNAIKFTKQGSVTVVVRYDEANQQLKLAVSDTGIGMTATQRDTIAKFAAFQQADMSTARKYGGTGLGLHITSELTRLLGGQLEVDSTFGEGTTFTATLAAKPAEDANRWVPGQTQAAESDPGATADADLSDLMRETVLDGTRILLAEDGPDNQRLVSHYLRKAGAEVEICENGRQAVQRLVDSDDQKTIDLVLMDMQMPELDGYEATRQLREQGFDVPIIALTAHAMAGDRERCLNAGCDDYVTKPIDPVQLLTTCGRLAGAPATGESPTVRDAAVSTLA